MPNIAKIVRVCVGRPQGAAALLTLCVASVACGVTDSVDSGVAVRDSAGIEIVENLAPLWRDGEGWSLSAEPVREIGVVVGDPEMELHDVRAAARLSDGRIAIADGGTNEIRLFGPEGEFLRAVGGSGDGPGEFRTLSSLQRLAGDTLLAFDSGAGRATIYTDAGELVRTIAFTGDDGPRPSSVVRSRGGGFIGRLAQPFSRTPGINRPPIAILRYDADGQPRDTIGELPGTEWAIWQGGAGSPAFARSLVHAFDGRRLYVGTQETYEIRAYSADGEPTRILRGPARDLTYTEDELRAYVDRNIERADIDVPDAARRRYIDRLIESAPRPDTRPAYGELHADAAGNLWVAEYTGPWIDPTRWTVFDPDGRMLGTVEVPERFSVLEIGDDYVLGRWFDDGDIEYVRRYRLNKDGA